MKKSNSKKAHILYKEYFTKSALKEIYDAKISSSRTVGKDGIRQNVFKNNLDDEINLILKKVEACTYRFTTYKPKLISKGTDKPPRVLSIPTIRDRLTLRVLNDILAQVFSEARIWRPHVYIKNIRKIFEKPCDDMAFVRIDIKDFYPSIHHDILVKKVRSKIRKLQLIHLIRLAMSTPTYGVNSNAKGVPQGLSISNILSSIYLYKIDQKFRKKYMYFRYVDDILVICKASEAQAIFEEIRANIEALELTCHEQGLKGKSQISPVSKGVEYLGFYLTLSMISVRESSYTRMIENLLAVFTQFKHTDGGKKYQDRLSWRLNLKITGCIYKDNRFGWVFFFSQIDNLRQLARLDQFVTAQLNKRGIGHLRPNVKKFLRSYHEIRFNLRKTQYIPKYDEFKIEDIIKELSQEEGKSEGYFASNFTEQQIRNRFTRLIDRQTSLLEKDLIESIS